MKTQYWRSLVTAGLVLISATAEAAIEEGYYFARRGRAARESCKNFRAANASRTCRGLQADRRVHVIIKSVPALDPEAPPTVYGLMIKEPSDKISIFQITEMEGGTQEWIAIGPHGRVLGQYAETAYSATLETPKIGRPILKLIPSNDNPCTWTFRFKKYTHERYQWVGLPVGEDLIVRDRISKQRAANELIFKLDGEQASGALEGHPSSLFRLGNEGEYIPGLGVLYGGVLNKESVETGFSESPSVDPVEWILVNRNYAAAKDRQQIRTLNWASDSFGCGNTSTVLKERIR